METISKIAITGVTGTTLMTAASELMSLMAREEFREPRLLRKMMGRLAPFLSKNWQVLTGWGGHYCMGFVFAATYVHLWERGLLTHNLRNGILLGLASGVLGLLIWRITFKWHPLLPSVRRLDFYLQRIPAHVVFSVCGTAAYQLIRYSEECQKCAK
jgi:hypothetical protein